MKIPDWNGDCCRDFKMNDEKQRQRIHMGWISDAGCDAGSFVMILHKDTLPLSTTSCQQLLLPPTGIDIID